MIISRDHSDLLTYNVSFYVALCVVSEPNSRAIQSRVRVFAIFLEAVLKLFTDYFHWWQTEVKKNWWRKCQMSWGTRVPVKIQIWDWHSEVFCFQICIQPVAHGSKNNINEKHCPWFVAKYTTPYKSKVTCIHVVHTHQHAHTHACMYTHIHSRALTGIIYAIAHIPVELCHKCPLFEVKK